MKHTLKERNHIHQAFIPRRPIPRLEHDSVLGLQSHMFRVNVQNNYLGRITVEERDILDDFTLDRASRFTEKTVWHKCLVWVDLLRDRGGGLSRK